MPEPDSVARWELRADANSEHAPVPTADEQQVIQLFDELRGRLLRYLLGFGLPAPDGEEVIQEVFLALYQHLRRGGSRQNLPGWIFRVAHNLGLKLRLARTREAATITPSEESLAAAWDPAENPEELLSRSQRQQRLQSALDALPEQDRCCLLLRAEGLRYR